MDAEPIEILTPEQADTERQAVRQVRRDNWAFSRGGSYDLVTLEGGRTFAVVENPAELTEPERAEIAEALRRTTLRTQK